MVIENCVNNVPLIHSLCLSQTYLYICSLPFKLIRKGQKVKNKEK